MTTAGEIILLIERAGKPEVTFAPALERKGFTVDVVPTGQEALKRAGSSRPALIVLNAASLGSNGLRICHRLKEQVQGVPVIHVLAEDAAGSAGESPARVTLIMPFTPRKLINRVKRFMPGQRQDEIVVGPIRFAPGVRIVEAHGREKRLTPKTASLLEVFLKHPGQVLDRGFLMREVWHTDYVGDTRTLDVHVRWVREAIEPEPASPCHIVTVRRVGYRFDPGPPSTKDGSKRSASS
jgi:DNA-binding response OmpR family regulator